MLLVLCTCPDEDSAIQIAERLVDARLAACVNRIANVASTFRWQECVERQTEQLLLIKTTESCYQSLEESILRWHPYQTPEIISFPIERGYAAFLEWVNSNTQKQHPEPR